LKDVKKANAQNFFFLNDNFFPFLFFVDVATLLFCLCGIKDVPTKVDDAIFFLPVTSKKLIVSPP
jgi:hypothetical protein